MLLGTRVKRRQRHWLRLNNSVLKKWLCPVPLSPYHVLNSPEKESHKWNALQDNEIKREQVKIWEILHLS